MIILTDFETRLGLVVNSNPGYLWIAVPSAQHLDGLVLQIRSLRSESGDG